MRTYNFIQDQFALNQDLEIWVLYTTIVATKPPNKSRIDPIFGQPYKMLRILSNTLPSSKIVVTFFNNNLNISTGTIFILIINYLHTLWFIRISKSRHFPQFKILSKSEKLKHVLYYQNRKQDLTGQNKEVNVHAQESVCVRRRKYCAHSKADCHKNDINLLFFCKESIFKWQNCTKLRRNYYSFLELPRAETRMH